MKIHVASDLHFEKLIKEDSEAVLSRFNQVDKSNVDALILAGDVFSLKSSFAAQRKRILDALCTMYSKVIYVPGNHEYWGTTIDGGNLVCAKLAEDYPNLIVLLNQPAYLNARPTFGGEDWPVANKGKTMFGGTLWYKKQPNPRFIDLARIYGEEQDIYNQHQKFLDNVTSTDIIVSHHFPTEESIAPMWRSYSNNGYFCAQIEKEIAAKKLLPKIWIHGHTHNAIDFVSQSGFRVYANPMGYVNEDLNPNFWERLEIEV